MRQIKCKSGLIGWEDYLKGVYSSKKEFLEYDEIYGIAARLGYDNPEECWRANPLVQGSTDPSDFKKSIKQNEKTTYKKGIHF